MSCLSTGGVSEYPFSTPPQEYVFDPTGMPDNHTASNSHLGAFLPFGDAIDRNRNDEVKRLLDSGVSPNERQGTMSPLGIAIQANNMEAFTMLVNHKDIDINQYYTVVIAEASIVYNTRITAIVDAINLGNPEMMRILLDKGAKVDYLYETIAYPTSGSRPYMDRQSTPLLTGLVNFGYYSMGAEYPTSPFDVHKQFEQLQRIADKTTNLNRILVWYNTPSTRIGPGNVPYDDPYDPVYPYTTHPESLLMIAIQHNNYLDTGSPFRSHINKILYSIIERGADIHYSYWIDMEMVMGRIIEIDPTVAKLMQANAKYNVQFPLRTAVSAGNAPMVDYLLKKGVNMEIAGDNGGTVFMSTYTPDVLNTFLNHGIDINLTMPNGYALIFGAVHSQTGLLEEMLKLGVDPNIETGGMNALSVTEGLLGSRKREVVKLLEEYGAVPIVKGKVNSVITEPPTPERVNAMQFAILNPNGPNLEEMGVTAVPSYRKHDKYLAKMMRDVKPLYDQLVKNPTAEQWNKIIVAMEKVVNDVNSGR